MNGQRLASAGDLSGRTLLALLFVVEALSKLGGYDAAARYMAAFGVSPRLLPLAIVVELGAGILVMLGWHTRVAALALAGFCVAAAVMFHTRFSDRNQLIHFEKDLALAGAFLILAARGAGRFSLDAAWSRRGTMRGAPA
ncbi:MAG: DoxX family protein [Xanthobacteraceae bacterium]